MLRSPLIRAGFLHCKCCDESPEHGIPHATKLPGAVWNGEAGPEGGGQEARNTVVHRPKIQNKSAF